MENDWSGTLQNNNIICIFTQKIKLFQLNKYDQFVDGTFYTSLHLLQDAYMSEETTQKRRFKILYISHWTPLR